MSDETIPVHEVNPHTGEATVRMSGTRDDLARLLRSMRRSAAAHRAEEKAHAKQAAADEHDAFLVERALLTRCSTGEQLGHGLVVVHGPRENTKVRRDAVERNVEALEDLGLVERVPQPPPPPKIRPASVTLFRAHEAELAKRGLRLDDLLEYGGPGEPVIESTEDTP